MKDAYLALLRQKFPEVEIRDNLGVPYPGEGPVLDVFCIPDDRMYDFTKFIVEELPDALVVRDLPRVTLIPHSESATREYYVDVCPHLPERDVDTPVAAVEVALQDGQRVRIRWKEIALPPQMEFVDPSCYFRDPESKETPPHVSEVMAEWGMGSEGWTPRPRDRKDRSSRAGPRTQYAKAA